MIYQNSYVNMNYKIFRKKIMVECDIYTIDRFVNCYLNYIIHKEIF